MYVSVIIPHYNDLDALDICLTALKGQTFPAEQMEIIVADNMSPQGLGHVAAVIGNRARLVEVPRRGAGPARNGGVVASKGEVLAFIDSDCRATPRWLSCGVAALENYDVVGGRVEVSVRDPDNMTAAEAFESVFAFNMERYFAREGFVGSGNLFCRRSVFDAVGAFGTGVSEDVDWSHRAAAKNFAIGFAPDAAVSHPARRTWAEFRGKWARINFETYGLKKRRKNGRLLWFAKGLMLPASAIAHTPRVLRSKRLTPRQKVMALGMLYKIRLWRMWDYMRLLRDVPRR